MSLCGLKFEKMVRSTPQLKKQLEMSKLNKTQAGFKGGLLSNAEEEGKIYGFMSEFKEPLEETLSTGEIEAEEEAELMDMKEKYQYIKQVKNYLESQMPEEEEDAMKKRFG